MTADRFIFVALVLVVIWLVVIIWNDGGRYK